MKCPKCQKPDAKISSYYPHLLTHKCDGQNLEEVGQLTEPDGSKIVGKSYYIDWLEITAKYVGEVFRIKAQDLNSN